MTSDGGRWAWVWRRAVCPQCYRYYQWYGVLATPVNQVLYKAFYMSKRAAVTQRKCRLCEPSYLSEEREDDVSLLEAADVK